MCVWEFGLYTTFVQCLRRPEDIEAPGTVVREDHETTCGLKLRSCGNAANALNC